MGDQYPAILTLRNHAWNEFTPFLDWDTEILRVICSTNAIEFPVRTISSSSESTRRVPERCLCTEMPIS